jgi:hypothetical protein
MPTWMKVVLISIGAGVPAFLATPTLFPPNPKIPPPAESLLPYFLAMGIVEAIFFGVGVAFLALGFPMMRRVATVSGISPWPAYLSIGYLTASWWPHLGMHAVAGVDAEKLLLVDYGFHLPYIVAASVVAYFFFRTLQATAKAAPARAQFAQPGTWTDNASRAA